MIEDDASTDFSRGITPSSKPTRRGDPLPSIMAGALSIVVAIVNLAALLGLGPQSIPGLVKRVTIVIVPPVNGFGGVMAPGNWFVPEADFWVLATVALSLASVGILLSRGRGRPLTSLIGFGLNTIALLAGFLLALTDYQQR